MARLKLKTLKIYKNYEEKWGRSCNPPLKWQPREKWPKSLWFTFALLNSLQRSFVSSWPEKWLYYPVLTLHCFAGKCNNWCKEPGANGAWYYHSRVFIFKIVCSQLLGSLSLILKYIFPTVPCSAQLACRSDYSQKVRRDRICFKNIIGSVRPTGTYDRFKQR